MRRGGEDCGASANEYSCAHGAQINFGDLTPYLTYGSFIEFFVGTWSQWDIKITKRPLILKI